MKKEALSLFGNPDLILLSFILFFITFLGLLFWVYMPSRKGHFKKMAQMPLEQRSSSHE